MNNFSLISKSLRFYWRTHITVLLGVILSTGVLTGSLIIGDSIKYSLQNIVFSRLGKSEFILISNSRFFKADLSDRLQKQTGITTAPILLLKGIAGKENSENKTLNIQICGIDNRFWNFANEPSKNISIAEDEVILNKKTASELNIKINDEIIIQIEKTRFIPSEAPFVPDNQNSVSFRLKVKKIITEKQLGNFNIQSSQITPFNIFISRELLAKKMSLENYANIILLGNTNNKSDTSIYKAIKEVWALATINLKFRNIPDLKQTELISNRIFIEDTIQKIVSKIEKTSEPIFTYLINQFRKDPKETPYSFCSSTGNLMIASLKENEVIINDWLAEDLFAKNGDTIELSYFTVGPLRKLKEEKKDFIVREIIPFRGLADDKFLMPEFEGLAHVDHCKDWEAGIPIRFKKIRPKDEEYWKIHKGTPKAFISYSTAKKLWGTRFGNCTSIRFNDNIDTLNISKKILSEINPQTMGLFINPVKKEGLWSAGNGVDFGQLFLSLSFFLLITSLILTSLLFSLNIDARAREQGILKALGFNQKQIKKLFLTEGIIIAFFAVIGGAFLGIFFNQLVLSFLNTIWNDVVRTNSIEIHIKPLTVLTGCTISFLMAVGTMLFSIRKKQLFSLNNLIRKNYQESKKQNQKKSKISLLISSICFISVILIFVFTVKGKLFQNTSFFMISGVLLLVGIISFFDYLVIYFSQKRSNKISINRLSFRNIFFRRKRSLTLLIIISAGTFLIISTGLNKPDFSIDSTSRESGTGGYLFYGETTFPIVNDLNTKQGKENFNLPDTIKNLSFVQIRTACGEDASCLNLNRVVRPRIIGVNPNEFASKQAFSFSQKDELIGKNNPWIALNQKYNNKIYPAIADQTVITWSLGKSIGDTISYTNELGETIGLKLIAGLSPSIFQGNIIISDKALIENFPSVSGSKILLVDAPKNNEKIIKEIILNSFNSYGITLTPSHERMAMFNSVTNTYLDVFIALGGIALILSTIGIAIIITRNILEQKSEFAMMQALGFSKNQIIYMIIKENILILFSGIIAGLIAGLISTLPSLANSGLGLPYKFMIILISLLISNGIFWILISAKSGIKSKFIIDLKTE